MGIRGSLEMDVIDMNFKFGSFSMDIPEQMVKIRKR